LACAPSAVIPAQDIEIVCVSGSDSGMKIFFQSAPSITCTGAHVQELGNTRVVTFLKEPGSSSLPLNTPATTQKDGVFAGTQVIMIPFSPEQRDQYGEIVIRMADEDYPVYRWQKASD